MSSELVNKTQNIIDSKSHTTSLVKHVFRVPEGVSVFLDKFGFGMYVGDAGMIENKLDVVDYGPGAAGNDPGMIENYPGIIDSPPGMIEGDPGMVEGDPGMVEGNIGRYMFGLGDASYVKMAWDADDILVTSSGILLGHVTQVIPLDSFRNEFGGNGTAVASFRTYSMNRCERKVLISTRLCMPDGFGFRFSDCGLRFYKIVPPGGVDVVDITWDCDMFYVRVYDVSGACIVERSVSFTSPTNTKCEEL